jgi:hypothetical protein
LIFDQPESGPHNVRFLAALRIALEPIRAAQTVLIRRALEKLGEGCGLVAWKVDGNRNTLRISHSGPPTRVAVVRAALVLATPKAESDILDLNKSQAIGRYGKPGTRTADDVDRKAEEVHLKLARDEYKELEGLRMKIESELELERRKLADQAADREDMARKHARGENRMAS